LPFSGKRLLYDLLHHFGGADLFLLQKKETESPDDPRNQTDEMTAITDAGIKGFGWHEQKKPHADRAERAMSPGSAPINQKIKGQPSPTHPKHHPRNTDQIGWTRQTLKHNPVGEAPK